MGEVAQNQSVTVYTQPGCANCEAEKAFLRQQGISFVELDITRDEAALAELRSRNIQSTPVTRVRERFLVGFHRNRLLEMIRSAPS